MICNICIEPSSPLSKYGDVINTSSCSHKAHIKCMEMWQRPNEFGKIIDPTRLCCPECKEPSYFNSLGKSNEEILKIINENPDWFYIVCPSCRELKQFIMKQCINEIETEYRLVCNNCSYDTILYVCPQCISVTLWKRDGLSIMITCGQCYTNFCCICREHCNSKNIISHIDTKHTINLDIQTKNNESDYKYIHYLMLLEIGKIKITDIPREFHTKELILISMKVNKRTIKYMNQSRKNKIYAITMNHRSLKYIDIQDKETCISSVNKDVRALKYMTNQDENICILAVKNNPIALKYIINQTDKICVEAIIRDSTVFKYIKNKSPKLILTLIKYDGKILKYLDAPTKKMCLLAVQQNGESLKYVNTADKRDYTEICFEAVRENGKALRYVKKRKVKDYHLICLEAVKQDGNALPYVRCYNSSSYREICLEAVKRDGLVLCYVDNQDEGICLAAVKQNKSALNSVDNKYRKWCEEIIQTQ